MSGTTWRWQNGVVYRYLPMQYGLILTVVVNDAGIGFSVPFPLRIGHPALFIPWSEVVPTEGSRLLLFTPVRLTLPKEPSVWIELNASLAERIQNAIGRDWFEGR